jgi:hypothetical protein
MWHYTCTLHVCLHGVGRDKFALNHNRLLHAVAQWLRHCATNRKVAGSFPDDVIGIFH